MYSSFLMRTILLNIARGIDQLFFPRNCAGCGSDLITKEQLLCLGCINNLPVTNFHMHANNPVEKIFWGRLPVRSAASLFYFTKGSLLQRLLHQFKYRGNKEIGYLMGTMMGKTFVESNRFAFLDGLVALPLHKSRERRRGYNQAAILCEGFSAATGINFYRDVIVRAAYTETQTQKGRLERWQNIEGRFALRNSEKLRHKRILLVDDVVTTGATLEACGQELLRVEGLELNIATMAYTSMR